MSHTPTPWKVATYNLERVFDESGLAVADCCLNGDRQLCEKNAARIVKCVNSHDALVDAVKAAKKHLNHREFDAYDRLECLAQLDAALALAEPKETDK